MVKTLKLMPFESGRLFRCARATDSHFYPTPRDAVVAFIYPWTIRSPNWEAAIARRIELLGGTLEIESVVDDCDQWAEIMTETLMADFESFLATTVEDPDVPEALERFRAALRTALEGVAPDFKHLAACRAQPRRLTARQVINLLCSADDDGRGGSL